MIQILVTDDEHHVVDYITGLLDREGNGEWAVFGAYNGYDAMEILRKNRIDIALLDVEMPGMSGLELGARIKNNYPGTRIIYLTAYDIFEYIYKAEKLDIDGFLLKTEDDHVILNKVSQTVTRIHAYNDEHGLLSRAKNKELMLNHMLAQDVYKALAEGDAPEKILEKIDTLEADFSIDPRRKVVCIMGRIPRKAAGGKDAGTSDGNIRALRFFCELFGEACSIGLWNCNQDSWVLFLQDGDEEPEEGNEGVSEKTVNTIREKLQEVIDFYMTSFRIPIYLLFYEEAFAFEETNHVVSGLTRYAEWLLKSVVSFDPMAISLHAREIEEVRIEEGGNTLSDTTRNKLYYYLQKGDKEQIMKMVHVVRDKCIRQKSMHDLSCIKSYNTIAMLIIDEVSKYKLEKKLAMSVALYPLYYLNEFNSWEQAFAYIEKVITELLKNRNTDDVDKNQLLVDRIREYVRLHYKETLNLSIVANQVNYNESYVSRVFKQVNGTGLADYINQVRLEKAEMLLLATNDSIQQIARDTGFETPQYFSVVFKKYFGISPSDYRMKC